MSTSLAASARAREGRRSAPHITADERLLAPLERLIGVRSIDEADEGQVPLDGHAVIVGFGLAGRFAARTLRECDFPFVVLELNADNVRRGKELGLPVYYGDATSEEALRHAHLERDALFKLGAHDVVAEEVESAVEIISRLLRSIEVPRNVIEERIRGVRMETQTSDRKLTVPRSRLGEVRALAEMKIECARVHEGSPAAGASPVTMRLRNTTGALVVGVRRGEKLLEKPDPAVPFEPGDVVYFVGTGDALTRTLPLFDPDVSARREG